MGGQLTGSRAPRAGSRDPLLEAVRDAARALAAGSTEEIRLDAETDGALVELLEALAAFAGASGGALEEALVETGRAAALGRLAAGAAHEINNPLFAILGLVELLAADAEPGTKTRERLELIQASGAEIREIARAMLDFSRAPLHEDTVLPLREVVAEMLALLRRTSMAKDVEIVERVEGGDVEVAGNRAQLELALLSLVVLVTEATGAGGSLTVSVGRAGDAAVASVTGAHPGASAAMSLAVARGIARRHGGSLAVELGPGGTASFALELPPAVER